MFVNILRWFAGLAGKTPGRSDPVWPGAVDQRAPAVCTRGSVGYAGVARQNFIRANMVESVVAPFPLTTFHVSTS